MAYSITEVNALILSKLAVGDTLYIDDICCVSVKRVGCRSVTPKSDNEYPHRELFFSPPKEKIGESLRDLVGEESFEEWKKRVISKKKGDTVIEVKDCFRATISPYGSASYIPYNELSMQLNPFGSKELKSENTTKRALFLTLMVILVPMALMYVVSLIMS